jgi:hypothetical protein
MPMSLFHFEKIKAAQWRLMGKTFIQSSHFLGFAGNISKRKAILNRPRFSQFISMSKQDNARNSFVHQQANFYR